ncbi:MAG: ABC transporter permease [Porphyromonas sp.]|nr:ABC transporter permease [Porphyromonas sp.]
MSLEQILAERFLYQSPKKPGQRQRLRPVVLISSIGIALGVALILLSLFVVRGFKSEIRGKITAMAGNVRISNPENSYNQYTIPLTVKDDLMAELLEVAQDLDPAGYVASFTQTMALLKSDSTFRGVMMLGRSELRHEPKEELYSDLAQYLLEGSLPRSGTNEVIISKALASYLGFSLGDDFTAYFGNNEQIRLRKYTIAGIYETGYEQYDKYMVLLGESSLKSVLGWSPEQASGLMVHLSSDQWDSELYDRAFDLLADRTARYKERYALFTSQELNSNMYGWLDLLDANVLLIMVLMIAVVAMTIITGVIVLVLEKVPAFATLKSLGQDNSSLKKSFRLMAGNIILRGLLLGNAIALLLAFIQKQWHLIRLDASQYFMTFVPVEIDLPILLWTNVGVFLLVYLFVLIPTSLIATISPASTLRFE